MEALIQIQQTGSISTVSARELHQFLESKRDFSNWISTKIEKYGFIKDEDFTTILLKSTKGRPKKEYAISIGMAKELAMLENNAKGKQARKYFIECEKNANELQTQVLEYQTKELKQIRQTVIEIQAENRRIVDYFSIVGYARIIKQSVPIRDASILGRKASKLCKANNIRIEKIQDPRFGYINAYSVAILKQVFKGYSAF
ncbi:MAG: antA/AntB antirepressor family protein [Polaribacter sp.]